MSITALDIGGMSIRSGLVRSDGTVDSIAAVPVDHRGAAPELIAAIRTAIDRCRAVDDPRVAIAVPGPFDEAAGISHMTHKFAALEGIRLGPALCAAPPAADLDIRFVNDAAAAGAGEVHAAGAAGTTLVITLGTGMGSSLFVDGALTPTVDGVEIAELWNHRLRSGATADEQFSATGLAACIGVATGELPSAAVAAASQPVLAEWATTLGSFLDQLRSMLGFDRVILGGGAAGAFDRFAPALRQATTVEVDQAKLGSSGPLLGASLLAFGVD